MPVDAHGVVDPDALSVLLASDPPDLVHLTAVPAHRGLVQPVAAVHEACRSAGVPLWVDAAQALGHVALPPDLDAVYAPSRKWLLGPRGSGVVAVAPHLRERLRVSLPDPAGRPAVRDLESHERAVAVQVGFAVAVAEHLAAGPAERVTAVAERGDAMRAALAGAAGWETLDVPGARCAILGLRPTTGQDVVRVRDRLEQEHGVRTTVSLPWRAPDDLAGPALRLAPRADTTDEEIARAVAALAAVG